MQGKIKMHTLRRSQTKGFPYDWRHNKNDINPVSLLMLRQLSATILLLTFSVQTFSNQLIMLGYYVNTGAYAKNCINKARPKLHCNGKCQAMKKLQQEEKKDQQTPERKPGNEGQVLFAETHFGIIHFPLINNLMPSLYSDPYSPSWPAMGVFHPPQ